MKNSLLRTFLLISVLASGSLLSCAESSNQSNTPIKKGAPGAGGSTKPQDQKKQKALNDKVLLLLQNTSVLQSAQPETIAVWARFKLNNREQIAWRIVAPIKIGENLSRKEAEQIGFDDSDLSLSVTGKRISRTSEKNDLGILVLVFELKRKTDTAEMKSYEIVAINLNRINRPQAFLMTDFQYPMAADFSLDQWIKEKLMTSAEFMQK